MGEETPFKPRGVIFDMDGLMLDTERPAIDAWVRSCRELGLDVDGELAARTIGVDEPTTRAMLFEALGQDFPYEKSRQGMRRFMMEEVERNGIPQKPGLIPLLDHLAARRIPLAVATSTERRIAEWKLEKGGIRERFTLIICGDEIKRGKPAPDIFLKAQEKLGIPASECIGFEDSPAGLKALYAAGIKSVFIKDMLEPPEAVLALVWRRLSRLDEAINLFD
jgi:HAD superfamily hydrolase (TIGR01509 family)